ncbi:Hypothetical predicted protein [Paramuricea clavata]|uniref:Uncharacterized protein n=1 Tax=Paramuricea clavata TaxID=317549 RepID=A0A6S7HNJ4_PARCT|nr:Hypothetical predicted protein [Paramuricea clavata]
MGCKALLRTSLRDSTIDGWMDGWMHSVNIPGGAYKGTTDDSIRIIIIATTVGAGVFLGITLIVLLIKYKRLKRASKLSIPVNIPLEVNEISLQPLPVDEEAVYETVPNVDQGFYEDVATNANESEDISAEGQASLHNWTGVLSNADKTSGYETSVENEHQTFAYETSVENEHREFYDDVATNANASEDISSEGQ